jgi:tetratricopeptide (TPR) repeat protein
MQRTTRTTTIVTLVAGAAFTGMLALPQPRPASAQDALGGGNALDHNLSTEGTVNPRAYQEDFRARNLLVTDNVPGGRGFRESVGYSAERDFRGVLGSDDLYQFRAGSAFSAPAFINYGRTYEQLRFGRELASLEYTRDFQGATLRDIQAQTPAAGEVIDARLRLDRISRSSQGLGIYESAPSGDMVGLTYDKDGRLLVARASSVYGISMTPAESDGQQIGLTLYDMARIREQSERDAEGEAPMIGKPFEPAFDEAVDPFRRDSDRQEPEQKITGDRVGERTQSNVPIERVDTRESSMRLEPGQQTSYRDVLKRVVERYADNENVSLNIDPKLIKEFEEEYSELRHQLRGTVDRKIPGAVPEAEADGEEAEATEPANPAGTTQGPGADRLPASEHGIPDRATLSEIDQLASALRHGQRIDKLSTGDETRFNELVAQAEHALRQGEFFLAERRFDRALRFNPGHPLATAGMGHAQIGSGLYLSAALTLRNLLTSNPEMIDVRYDAALVPARSRLESAITSLRQRLEKKQDVALNSFLLAYIGRLLEDKTLMREGLDGIATALPGDALGKLLRAVWIDDAAPADPKPAPASSPADQPQK